jgi:phosphohistidine phosphatase
MKTLLLMRHAKSSWNEKDITDFERPLTKRGRIDAPLMGQLIIDRELLPQRIVSSSAARALQTAELVRDVLVNGSALTPQVDFLDNLYMAETPEYYDVLRALPDDVERVMIIGHNPALETMLQLLSERIEALPTAVLAHLILPIDRWEELNFDTTGELVDIWRPKELREGLEKEAEARAKEAREKEKEKKKEKGKEKTKEKEKDKDKEKDKKKGK